MAIVGTTIGRVAVAVGLVAIFAIALVAALFATGEIGGKTLTGEIRIIESQLARLDREVPSNMAGTSSNPGDADGGLCLELAGAVDVAPGHPVFLYDEAGSVIGQGRVGQAEPITDAARQPSDDFTVCRFPFRVEDIRRTDTVTIEIGSERRATYPADELDRQDWSLAIPLGS